MIFNRTRGCLACVVLSLLPCIGAAAPASTGASPGAAPKSASAKSHTAGSAARRGGTKSSKSARHARPAHVTKGPPPPAWTIRPKRHQTPVTEAGYSDGDPPPWNARWGCASPAGPASGLAAAIGVFDDDLKRALMHAAVGPPAGEFGCIPYAILMRDDGAVLALALVASEGTNGTPVTLTFGREDPDGPFVLRTEPWPTVSGGLSFSMLSLSDVLDRSSDADPISPSELSYEVVGLVRGMLADLDVADPDALFVRLAMHRSVLDGTARLVGAEIVDPATGRSLRQALWVDREGVPGGFFTPNGESLEPTFWTNPVVFRYISRGVGTASARRRSVADRSGKRGAAPKRPGHALHIGVDFVAPTGTPAVAVADGTVLFMGYFGGYGNLAIVEHAGGYTTHYGHLSAFASDVAVGTLVRRGTTLGYVGATGLATGSHLHFEIRHEGAYVDPLEHTQPLVLWSLRRVDYAALARQVLSATTPAQPPSPEATPAIVPAAAAPPATAGSLPKLPAFDAAPQD